MAIYKLTRKDKGEWVTIATFTEYSEALNAFNLKIEEDKRNGCYIDSQLLDTNDKPLVQFSLSMAKPKFARGGFRGGNVGRPKGTNKKMVSIRMTEEEKVKVKEFLAQIRSENKEI